MTEDPQDHKMSLTDHLIELRKCLTRSLIAVGIGFLACWFFKDILFTVITQPLITVLPKDSFLIFTGVTQPLFTFMKICLFASMILTSPFIFYQLWKFISPALLPTEKIYVLPFVISSTLLFCGGVLFGYFVVLPPAFAFFVSFNNEYLQAMISFSEYLSLFIKFLLGFGLSFQLPVLMFFLTKLGIVNAQMLSKQRKYAILIIFITAAILTPSPDALSQILLAIPLMFLYEVSIVIARFVGRQKAKKLAKENQDTQQEE